MLSLGKLGGGAAAGGWVSRRPRPRRERAAALGAVSAAGLDPTRLRRRARTQLGRGPVKGPPTGPLSRSLTSKAVFAAAEAVAGEDRPVGVSHLFAALAEDVDAVTARIIRQGGADVAKLRSALREAGGGGRGGAGEGPRRSRRPASPPRRPRPPCSTGSGAT